MTDHPSNHPAGDKPYKSRKARPFHHFLSKEERGSLPILAQRAAEATCLAKDQTKGLVFREAQLKKQRGLLSRMNRMYGRKASKEAVLSAINTRKILGLDEPEPEPIQKIDNTGSRIQGRKVEFSIIDEFHDKPDSSQIWDSIRQFAL